MESVNVQQSSESKCEVPCANNSGHGLASGIYSGRIALWISSPSVSLRSGTDLEITRREVLKMTAAAGASATVPAQLAEAASVISGRSRSSQPNILLIMSDQHRGDCIGAYGNRFIHTPNLDEIARGGALFRQAYTTTPSCIPARAALLTGRNPWENGLLGMDGWPIAPSYPTELPRLLKNAGYHTVGIGKMEFGPLRSEDHGFDEMILDETANTFRDDYVSWFLSEAPNLNPWDVGLNWNAYAAKAYPFPERLHHTHWTGQTAVNFLSTYQKQKPFFLKVSFIPPHSPYTPPARFLQQYWNAELPPAWTGNWDSRYKIRSDPGEDIWHGDLGAQQVHESRAGYYGQVSFVDEQIGHILEALDQRGWMEETLIVYTSDHGDMLGDHYLWRKCQPYQSDVMISDALALARGFGEHEARPNAFRSGHFVRRAADVCRRRRRFNRRKGRWQQHARSDSRKNGGMA